MEVEVGTRLTLTVNITEFNRDIDSVIWTLDGMAIENGVDGYTLTNIILEAPPSMASLTRENVISPAEDSGNYTVTVTNLAGSDASEFNVTVTGEFIGNTKLRKYVDHNIIVLSLSFSLSLCLSLHPSAARPSVINPQVNISVTVLEQMGSIILNCSARGIPTPIVTWYRGTMELMGVEDRITISDPLESSDAEGFYYVDSTLTISPSNRDDTDIYYCEAENTVLGSQVIDRRQFNVTVNCM